MRASQFTLFGLLIASNLAYASFDFNLTPGVTPISHDIYNLHMTVIGVCVVIGIIVFGTMGYAIIHHRKSKGATPANVHGKLWLEITWTIIPFLILVGVAIPGTRVLMSINNPDKPDLTIKVTGYQWKWRYEYLDHGINFFSNISTPFNQIYGNAPRSSNYLREVDHPLVLPIHKKVRILVTSNDVIHSWWVPDLGVKKSAIPGFINETWARINRPGTYHGQCAELCGINHAYMPIVISAVSEKGFNDWVAKQKALPAVAPASTAPAVPTTVPAAPAPSAPTAPAAAPKTPEKAPTQPSAQPEIESAPVRAAEAAAEAAEATAEAAEAAGPNSKAAKAAKAAAKAAEATAKAAEAAQGAPAAPSVQPIAPPPAPTPAPPAAKPTPKAPPTPAAPPAKPAPSAPSTPIAPAATAAAPAPAGNKTLAEQMKQGEQIYLGTCAVCHQQTGEGIPPTYPALKGSPIATGPLPAHLNRVLNGKPGTAMQAFRDQFNDDDLSAVITYERNSWGNNGGVVQPTQVAAARKLPPTGE